MQMNWQNIYNKENILMEKLFINDYEPVSELVVKETRVMTPMFPVIDIHNHFGSFILKNNIESMYNTEETVNALK